MQHPSAAAGRTAYSDLPLELWTAILSQLASMSATYGGVLCHPASRLPGH